MINKGKHIDAPPEFKIGNKMSKDGSEIVNAFNNLFANIGSNLAKKIDTPPNVDHTLYFKYIIHQSMFFWPTDENELENISSDLKSNSSSGHDELLSNILSNSIKGFLKPLTHIINCSLNTAIVADNMKIAKITPVFKTDDKHDMNNYRLISILPYFFKILEKVVYKRTMDFVTKSNMINSLGFAKNTLQPWLYWRLLIKFLRQWTIIILQLEYLSTSPMPWILWITKSYCKS